MIKLNKTKRQNTLDGRDILTGIENVNGGAGDDIIQSSKGQIANNNWSSIYGGDGNDTITSSTNLGSNKISIYGGKGDDIINGGDGNYTIYGDTSYVRGNGDD